MEEKKISAKLSDSDDSFISAPFRGKNAFWRYFTGAVAPFIASNAIGAIPLAVVLIIYANGNNLPVRGNMPDFEAMGLNLNTGFVLTVFPFVVAFLTLALLVRPLHERRFITLINGGSPVRWGRIAVSAAVWSAVSALWLVWSLKSDPGNFVLSNTSGSLAVLALLALLLIPFQAGFEEILFRGYLMQGFAVLSRNRWLPLAVTSILFGLMHALNPEVREYGFFTMIPQYVFFGLVFAVLTLMDNGVELAIGAHTANNAFLTVFVTNKDSALQTAAMYEQVTINPWSDFAGLVIMSVIFISIMAVIYRWKDISRLFAGTENGISDSTAEGSDSVNAG